MSKRKPSRRRHPSRPTKASHEQQRHVLRAIALPPWGPSRAISDIRRRDVIEKEPKMGEAKRKKGAESAARRKVKTAEARTYDMPSTSAKSGEVERRASDSARPANAQIRVGPRGRPQPFVRLRTIDETAEILSVSSRTVRRFIDSGALPVHRFGRSVRVSDPDIAQLLAAAAASRKWPEPQAGSMTLSLSSAPAGSTASASALSSTGSSAVSSSA
jgi:excisionase family DNA binding protein